MNVGWRVLLYWVVWDGETETEEIKVGGWMEKVVARGVIEQGRMKQKKM